jgi:signal transduction histidine kinase
VNLLKNANEMEGVRTIRVRSCYEPQKQIVRVEVRDDGPGIPANVQARLFEPFFTTKSRGSGTGLGLAISKRIIEEHNGSLLCKSSPGNGTAFLIELPA